MQAYEYGVAFGRGTDDATGFGGGAGDAEGSEPADRYSGDGKPLGYGTGYGDGWGFVTGNGYGTGDGDGYGTEYGRGEGKGDACHRGCVDCTGGGV